jgi:RNA polymerase sigma-70 factor (ECF subfamily)
MGRHTAKIFMVVLRILRNHADTEEITQDTFVRAHRGLAKFRGDSSLATWLYRIAVNLARNRYWYYVRRRRPDSISLETPRGEDGRLTFSDLIADRGHDPVQETIANEFSSSIAACMARLDTPHREILMLCNVLHHSYDEISATLGIKVGTVKSRIARARSNLRDLLAETCPELATRANLGGWFEPSRVMYGRPAIATG